MWIKTLLFSSVFLLQSVALAEAKNTCATVSKIEAKSVPLPAHFPPGAPVPGVPFTKIVHFAEGGQLTVEDPGGQWAPILAASLEQQVAVCIRYDNSHSKLWNGSEYVTLTAILSISRNGAAPEEVKAPAPPSTN